MAVLKKDADPSSKFSIISSTFAVFLRLLDCAILPLCPADPKKGHTAIVRRLSRNLDLLAEGVPFMLSASVLPVTVLYLFFRALYAHKHAH